MIENCPYDRPDASNVCSNAGLLYFVWEREAIRIARENMIPREQWTNDPVFKKYKFTNIRRRDDRVSRWIIKEIINLHLKNRDLWFALLVARLINWPLTLERLLYEEVIPCVPEDFDGKLFSKVIEQYKEETPSGKVYSGAYMIYPTKMDKGGNKSAAIAKYILGDAVAHALNIRNAVFSSNELPSIARVVRELSKCFGISTFIAGQVAADLTYARGHLHEAEDLDTYAPIGPGSSRGLNYLLGRKPFAGWTQEPFNDRLMRINQDIKKELLIRDLTLHDVQNVMCEYSKYCRVVLGEGVPKTLYKPEMEF